MNRAAALCPFGVEGDEGIGFHSWLCGGEDDFSPRPDGHSERDVLLVAIGYYLGRDTELSNKKAAWGAERLEQMGAAAS